MTNFHLCAVCAGVQLLEERGKRCVLERRVDNLSTKFDGLTARLKHVEAQQAQSVSSATGSPSYKESDDLPKIIALVSPKFPLDFSRVFPEFVIRFFLNRTSLC